MKEALLGLGAFAGLGITSIGLLALFSRPDPSTTYAGERLFDNIMGTIIGIPCLAVGIPLIGLCAWKFLN